ncbi:MAG: homoserine dehydrogenase [Anaerolineae bacterium]|nr:homoserine dehydrogenase [Anaerolineae bacterium]
MRNIAFGLLGVGGVGSTLLNLLNDEIVRTEMAARAGVLFRPHLLADRRGILAAAQGLNEAQVRRALEAKAAGGSVGEAPGGTPAAFLDDVWAALRDLGDLERFILVDATASDDTVPLLLRVLDAGGCVVLANKRPLTGEWGDFLRLTASRRCRFEATVGAGLPVIRTLQSLLDTGDRVLSIQGVFSGTLAYICTALNRGERYSEAVRSAMQAGYTEPDPRDDLGGIDVARKALILCRMMGHSIELRDVHVTSMIPSALEGLDLPAFLERLPEGDAEVEEIVREAASRGVRLSYVANIGGEVPVVGLHEVLPDSPIGRLSGTDNIVVFHTTRYRSAPMVIQGPGAGREVTAGGILADMVDLALCMP